MKKALVSLFLTVFFSFFGVPEIFAAPADAPVAWRQAIGGRILGRPVSQAESVVIACDDRSLRAYGRSGNPLWRFEAGEKLSPHIARSPEGTCYLPRLDGIFIAINRSGRELWRT
ncbi:MAG: PQQ-binding-like beta-propeller repeat protein, partial [Treponemataceae bacterium]